MNRSVMIGARVDKAVAGPPRRVPCASTGGLQRAKPRARPGGRHPSGSTVCRVSKQDRATSRPAGMTGRPRDERGSTQRQRPPRPWGSTAHGRREATHFTRRSGNQPWDEAKGTVRDVLLDDTSRITHSRSRLRLVSTKSHRQDSQGVAWPPQRGCGLLCPLVKALDSILKQWWRVLAQRLSWIPGI